MNPEWVEAGAKAIPERGRTNAVIAERVITAVEPLIRADADAKHICTEAIERARVEERVALAADIEAKAREGFGVGMRAGMFEAARIARGES